MKKNVILLVEDDELDVISVQRSLKKLDQEYELHNAYNGVEALELLRGRKGHDGIIPDVILLDLNMPKMNGIEFLKELRKDEQLKDVKVFIMTTSGEETDRKEADQLGISGYLIKPLNFTDNRKRTDSLDAFFQFHIRKILAN
ncbi:MAG: two-component response regulator [Sphingobacteriaceae bacterium]|jgi:CheY-like chemotaxis protein|nr:two-component response regulator [Sphingobacteriaceae bacterium]